MTDRGWKLPVKRQCGLLYLTRTGAYRTPHPMSEADRRLMRRIYDQHLKYSYYGARRISMQLSQKGIAVGRLHVNTLVHRMGIEAHCHKSRRSISAHRAMIQSHLLDGLSTGWSNQLWTADTRYLPMSLETVYLKAIRDTARLKVTAWRFSKTLTTAFCLAAFEEALALYEVMEIFNIYHGCQFTSDDWVQQLDVSGCRISMNGKGRGVDNVFLERRWRSVKYEDVYFYAYRGSREAHERLAAYSCGHRRLHQSLDYRTHDEVHLGVGAADLPLVA